MKNFIYTLIVFLIVPALQRTLTLIAKIIAQLSAVLDRVAYSTAKGLRRSCNRDTCRL